MIWVVILMSLSARRWHRGDMTLVGGRAVVTRASHVPIVIGASSEFRRPVWVHRVVYAAVNPLLLVATRLAGLAVGAARNGGRPA